MSAGPVGYQVLNNLVSALSAINGGAARTTTVDATSAAGQKVLNVASTTGWLPNRSILINRGGAREEVGVVDSIQADVSLTLKSNLTYEHTQAQADNVEQGFYWYSAHRTKSWGELRWETVGTYLAILLQLGSERVEAYLAGEYERVEREFKVQLWRRAPRQDPLDAANILVYEKLLADSQQAIMADGTRGGLAVDTHIDSNKPAPFDNVPLEMREIGLIGVEIAGRVRFVQATQDRHTQ